MVRTTVTYRSIVILSVALLDHLLHRIVVDEEALSVSQADIIVIVTLGLLLQTMVAVGPENDTVYVPMPDVM